MNALWLILTPLLGALLVACVPSTRVARMMAAFFTAGGLSLTFHAVTQIEPSASFQWVFRAPWIAALNVEWLFGVDGVSLPLIVLTQVLFFLVVCISWKERNEPRLWFAMLLTLQACLLGVFTALNFVPWFLFWELSLVPTFFLLKLWTPADRPSPALTFLIYTLAGSALLLVAFLGLYAASGTFDFLKLAEWTRTGLLEKKLASYFPTHTSAWSMALFVGVMIGLGVKSALFPLHGWMARTYGNASVPVVILLAALMSKMGVYAILRIALPIFAPQLLDTQTLWLSLAVVGAVWSAWVALVQREPRLMLAYSSMNHVHYILLGLFASVSVWQQPAMSHASALGLNGAAFQMLSHALIITALLFVVGYLEAFGVTTKSGLRSQAPKLFGFTALASLASMGVPALSGFVGEMMILTSAFGVAWWCAGGVALALVLTAVTYVRWLRLTFHGESCSAQLPDISSKTVALLAVLSLGIVLLGVYPQILTAWVNPTVNALIGQWSGL